VPRIRLPSTGGMRGRASGTVRQNSTSRGL
jgi:hypothetical protein